MMMIIRYFDDLLKVKIYKSCRCRYLILTILAGQPRLLARFSAFSGKNPRTATGVFARFAAGIMLLISLMEMLPAALAAEGMSPVLGYGMFIFGLLGYLALDRMLPHAHPQDLMQNRCSRCQNRSSAQPFCSLSASVCITSRKGLPPCHGEQQPS